MMSEEARKLCIALLGAIGVDPKGVQRAEFDFDANRGLSITLSMIPRFDREKAEDVTRIVSDGTISLHMVEAHSANRPKASPDPSIGEWAGPADLPPPLSTSERSFLYRWIRRMTGRE